MAIDGHSSCGKSTMARKLASRTGYTYIDTGAMYRAVTLYAIRRGLFNGNDIDTATLQTEISGISITFGTGTNGLQHTLLDGQDVETEIRGMEVSSKVSPIAALGFVRTAMVSLQRQMGLLKGIVMDGRDIGTVVYPEAELKVFVTAADTVRAQRRFDELRAKGTTATYQEVLENVRQRDYIDSHRQIAPLRPADDAIILDNSNLTIAQQDEWLYNHFLEAIGQKTPQP